MSFDRDVGKSYTISAIDTIVFLPFVFVLIEACNIDIAIVIADAYLGQSSQCFLWVIFVH